MRDKGSPVGPTLGHGEKVEVPLTADERLVDGHKSGEEGGGFQHAEQGAGQVLHRSVPSNPC